MWRHRLPKIRKIHRNLYCIWLQEDRHRRPYTATSRGEQLIPVMEDLALTTTTTMLPENMATYYNHPAINELRLMTENYKKLQEDYR